MKHLKLKSFDPASLLTDNGLVASAVEDAINDEDPRVLPITLRYVAQAKGVSMKELADRVGVGRESLYKTLGGKTEARWSTLQRVIRALDIKLKVAA